jgi:hypothetical protein
MSIRKMIVVAGLLLFAGVPVSARAAGLSGTWKGSFEFNGDSIPLNLHLAESGGAVTGTVEGLPTSPAEIHDGKIDGDTVSFWVNTDYEGTTYKLDFTGKVSGNEIAFTFGTDDGSWSSPLSVTRSAESPAAPADLTGTWKGAFDFQGNSVPLTFHLTETEGAVTGTIEGLPTTPTPIHDGKINGDAVSFWSQTDYQGETYKLVFTGKVSAGTIEFNFGTDDGGWGTTLTATKAEPAGNQ